MHLNLNNTSIAIVTPSETFNTSTPHVFNIFTAECYAILRALQLIKDMQYRKCIILSDSLNAVKEIQNVTTTNTITRNILELYNDLLVKEISVTIIWIPAHQGILGNEKLDKAAKKHYPCNSIIVPTRSGIKNGLEISRPKSVILWMTFIQTMPQPNLAEKTR